MATGVEGVVVTANSRAIAEAAFDNAISCLGTSEANCLFITICICIGVVKTCNLAGLKFTVASRSHEAVAAVLQFSAVEDIAVVVTIGVVTADDVFVRTANAEVQSLLLPKL